MYKHAKSSTSILKLREERELAREVESPLSAREILHILTRTKIDKPIRNVVQS